MNGRYREIFNEIWSRMSLRPFYFAYGPLAAQVRAMRITREAVERALEEFHDAPVRDDARIFLVSNMYALVVLPQVMNFYRHGEDPGNSGDVLQRLSGDAQQDTVQVLQAAMEQTREDGEVSSAAVVRGLGEVLENLKLKDAGIWASSGD